MSKILMCTDTSVNNAQLTHVDTLRYINDPYKDLLTYVRFDVSARLQARE